MAIINVRILHPTNGSEISIRIPEDTLLMDVFARLIEMDFLSGGQQHSGLNESKDGQPLDNEKSISENGVENNHTVRIVLSTMAGGGWEYIVQLWETVYPYLDQIGTVMGFAGGIIGMGTYLKNKFEKTSPPEYITDVITQENCWNPHNLASQLNISEGEARSLLRGFGYQYHDKIDIYSKTERTVHIIAEIQRTFNSLGGR